jgi:hypothetical protein
MSDKKLVVLTGLAWSVTAIFMGILVVVLSGGLR